LEDIIDIYKLLMIKLSKLPAGEDWSS